MGASFDWRRPPTRSILAHPCPDSGMSDRCDVTSMQNGEGGEVVLYVITSDCEIAFKDGETSDTLPVAFSRQQAVELATALLMSAQEAVLVDQGASTYRAERESLVR